MPPRKYVDPSPPKITDKAEKIFTDQKLQNIYEELFDLRRQISYINNLISKPSPANKAKAFAILRRTQDLKNTLSELDFLDEDMKKAEKLKDVTMNVDAVLESMFKKGTTYHNYMKKITAGAGAEEAGAEEAETEEEETEQEKRIKGMIEEFRKEMKAIRQHGTDKERQEIDVSRRVAEEEEKIQGPDADQKKVEFYQIMEASGGLDKKTAHEKTIEILTKSGKEQYATGNLKKPINPAINPQSVKMQKFNETLNIVTARPIAIKNAPHYEHPSHKLKMALKNFNTV